MKPNLPDIDKHSALSAYELSLQGDDSHNAKLVKEGLEEIKNDPMVFHPNHYTIGGIETIDFIRAKELDFLTGNAVKYIARSKYKGTEIQDLEKAIFNLQIKINDLKRANNGSGKATFKV